MLAFLLQIALYGMVVALAYCTAKYFKLFEDNNKRILLSGPAAVVSLFFAVVALLVSCQFEICHMKYEICHNTRLSLAMI